MDIDMAITRDISLLCVLRARRGTAEMLVSVKTSGSVSAYTDTRPVNHRFPAVTGF